MANYIDPHISDQELIGRDGRLYRKQSRKDFLAARADGGIDAAIQDSKRAIRPRVREGFTPPEGMSRSGALPPNVKTRIARAEAEGLIQVQRNLHGGIEAIRELRAEEQAE